MNKVKILQLLNQVHLLVVILVVQKMECNLKRKQLPLLPPQLPNLIWPDQAQINLKFRPKLMKFNNNCYKKLPNKYNNNNKLK
jgi:hypothetical protein